MDRRFKWSVITFTTAAFGMLFIPFFSPIILAVIFAFALDPLAKKLASIQFLSKYSRLFHGGKAAALTILIFALLITIPIIFALYNVYDSIHEASAQGFQNTEFYKDVMQLKKVFAQYTHDLIVRFNFKKRFDLEALGENFINQIGQDVFSLSTTLLSKLPEVVLFIFVFYCALYYFMAEQKQIRSLIISTKLMDDAEVSRFSHILKTSCASTLFVSVVVGFVQACVVSIGSAIFKVGDFFVVFVVTFFLSFIPIVGAAPVALFLGLLSLIKQDFGVAGGFVLIAIIAGSIDNVLRPLLVGNEEGLHPVVILLAILGAISIFGLPGLFLGPVIAMVTAKLYRAYILDN